MIKFVSLLVMGFLLNGCYMLSAPFGINDLEKRDDQDTYICGTIGGPPAGGKVNIISVPKGKPIPPDWRLPQC